MKKLLLLSILFIHAYISNAQFALNWINGITGTGTFYMNDMDVDANGNIYIIGQLNGTVDFDPGPGISNRTSVGNMDPVFARYTSTGTLVWANHIASNFSGWGMVNFRLKIGFGSVYVAGTFIGTADFDPGPGVANLVGVGNLAPFFGRYDLNGNYIWARTLGTNNNDHSCAIDVDGAGNCYVGFVCGGGGEDLDPGPGVVPFVCNGNTGTVAKFDALGNYVWGFSLPPTVGGWQPIRDVIVDNAANVYVSGIFSSGTIDLDPSAGTANITNGGGYDSYVVRYSTTGVYSWHGTYRGTSDDVVNDLQIDPLTNTLIASGHYNSASLDIDFSAGTSNLTSAAGYNGFVAKYSLVGAFSFGFKLEGNGTDVVLMTKTDACSDLIVGGYFDSPNLDINPGAGVVTVATSGSNDIFLTKFNATGTFLYGSRAGSAGSDVLTSIAYNSNSNSGQIAGYFANTVDFDFQAGVSNLTSASSVNGFMGNYTIPCSALPVELVYFDGEKNENAALLKWETSAEINNDYFIIEKSSDLVHWEQIGTVDGAGNSNSLLAYTFTDYRPYIGSNYYRLTQIDFDGTTKTYDAIELNFEGGSLFFPNPANEYIQLNMNEISTNATVTIQDLNGKTILTEKAKTYIYLSNFSKGVYILKIEDINYLKTDKIIIE